MFAYVYTCVQSLDNEDVSVPSYELKIKYMHTLLKSPLSCCAHSKVSVIGKRWHCAACSDLPLCGEAVFFCSFSCLPLFPLECFLGKKRMSGRKRAGRMASVR